MDVRIFMACKADIAQLSRLAGLFQRPLRAFLVEDPIRVFVADDLVVLNEVDAVGLQTAQRFVELSRGRPRRAAVDLGHQEGLLAVPRAQCLAHATLAGAVVVVPRVVHEGDAAIDRSADDADSELLVDILRSDVKPAYADAGNALTGAAERAGGKFRGDGRGRHGVFSIRESGRSLNPPSFQREERGTLRRTGVCNA